ncbi:PilX N-terminal domain-containing pilus assembly protein [Kingella kingae]|uniref:pilus assembly PilX family protein n=1 Tax=Kingella kingae TaxID=504 RepID=UPI0004019E92|nr:PilX N-terminal domain-containing pilus assembly protein [Kingella kingae]MDK4533531.1 PilX N-terminal domain-containing pilus assembly protein [Kingella kingae]MDK4539987.1 PilX N-terminal domain-containing pilus assembly protein [Kingella kingae]MDK4552564.1 PilX N-terminal domain-containing pilus assembly protein [Kingella kingae]
MKNMISRNQQQGFSLFFVMILMLVIAFLVIVTSQSSVTEMRMSTNEADRKYALSLAETGLRDGEYFIKNVVDKQTETIFTAGCKDGLCLPVKGSYSDGHANAPFKFDKSASSDYQAWTRCASGTASTNPDSCTGKTVLDDGCGNTCKTTNDKKTHYVIEYLGVRTDLNSSGTEYDHFRITSRARGQNKDTVVTLQSYVELLR